MQVEDPLRAYSEGTPMLPYDQGALPSCQFYCKEEILNQLIDQVNKSERIHVLPYMLWI